MSIASMVTIGQHGVRERMLEQDAPLRRALRARRADVVLVERLQHPARGSCASRARRRRPRRRSTGSPRCSAQPTGPLQAAACGSKLARARPPRPSGRSRSSRSAGSQCHFDARKSCRSSATTSGWVEMPSMLMPVLARSIVERGRDAASIPSGTEIRKRRIAPPSDDRARDRAGPQHLRQTGRAGRARDGEAAALLAEGLAQVAVQRAPHEPGVLDDRSACRCRARGSRARCAAGVA